LAALAVREAMAWWCGGRGNQPSNVKTSKRGNTNGSLERGLFFQLPNAKDGKKLDRHRHNHHITTSPQVHQPARPASKDESTSPRSQTIEREHSTIASSTVQQY
jgi:hypothetical protein